MKYLIPIIILGFLEVVLISKLHEAYGLSNVVIVYSVTTFSGALIAWLFYSSFKNHKSNSELGKKFQKRVRENRVSEVDKNKMVSLGYCTTYIIGCVMVAIPGLITDAIGFLLLLPPVTNFVASKYGETGFGLYSTNTN
jgi:UPF0716 family protein affecting phage T7 exclusion